MKQHQHRPETRAPHGAPEFTARVSFYTTEKQKRAFKKLGGSAWGRKAFDDAIAKGKT